MMINKINLALYIFLIGVTSLFFVSAQPVSNINIQGYVFYNNTAGVENGIPVIVNNTNLNKVFTTEVFAPNIPSMKGFYGLTIEGNTGHTVIVRAYNETHYGETTTTISSTTQEINVTLNQSRQAEVNTTIVYPESSQSIDAFETFNVTANITALVSDALNCVAVISFSNDSVLNVTGSLSENIGTIPVGNTVQVDFEVYAENSGFTNITVDVSCSNTDVFLEGNPSDTVNVTVLDVGPYIVTLLTPDNDTEEKTSNNISFTYNVSGFSDLDECSLFLNNTLNQTDTSPSDSQTNTFNVNLSNDYYTWYVECEDVFFEVNQSETRTLLVNVHKPVINQITLPSIINLNAGSTKQVQCNISVTDENSVSDISSVNATLYAESYLSSLDDNNTHYTNTSCIQTSFTGNTAQYTCGFNLLYYADNGTWICNATSTDNQGLTYTLTNQTEVDTLYAINISQSLLEFGEVSAGDLSSELGLDVQNIGNQEVSVDVRGYGGNDPLLGEGVAMLCDNNQNISYSNKRYSTNPLTAFNLKLALSETNTFSGLTISKQQTSQMQNESIYWQLRSGPGPVTNCEGTLVFTATAE